MIESDLPEAEQTSCSATDTTEKLLTLKKGRSGVKRINLFLTIHPHYLRILMG